MDALLTQAHTVYAYFNSIPASTWYAVAVFIGSSAAVSGFVEVLKRRFYNKNQEAMAKHIVATILGFSSFLITLLQGVILYGTSNPKFLGDRTLEIVGFATLLYHFGLSSGYRKVTDTLTKWVTNGRAIQAQAAAANMPETSAVVPPNTETPQTDNGQSLII